MASIEKFDNNNLNHVFMLSKSPRITVCPSLDLNVMKEKVSSAHVFLLQLSLQQKIGSLHSCAFSLHNASHGFGDAKERSSLINTPELRMHLNAGLTGDEKEEGAKAREQLELEQGDDGEEGGNYKTQNQFHTHLKKQEVSSIYWNLWRHQYG